MFRSPTFQRLRLGSLCLALLPAAALVLSGCGSTTSASDSLSNMRNVIDAYNRSNPSDVAQTGAACATAQKDLHDQAGGLDPGSSLLDLNTVTGALQSAYVSAEQGFSDCMQGARTMNYPLMLKADGEIAHANSLIHQAQKLAH